MVYEKKFVLTENGFWGILLPMILLRARTQSIEFNNKKRNGLFDVHYVIVISLKTPLGA